ncbi:MAG: exo-alpha-sialidase [Clostridia bacterium]|nr:exo-alpha-sialidase [Clostridia bacterium]
MKIEIIGKPEVVMSNPHSKHGYFAWPTAVRLQDGRIMVGASGFRVEHVCPFGKAVVSYSTDDGRTYTPPAPVIDTPLDDRDAGICTFGETGVIVTSFNNSADFQRQNNTANEYVQRYIDTITREDEEKYLGSLFRISNDCGMTFGEIHHSPVTSPHGPTQLRDGTILWAGNRFDNVEDGIEIVRLNTHTAKTEFVGKITLDDKSIFLNEPHLLEMPDGKLICHIRGENDTVFTTYQSISTDKGRTWTVPERLLDEDGGAPPHLIMLNSGILLSTYGRRKQPYGIMAMFSTDGGESWEKDIRLYENTGSDDLGYPTTVELNDGTLLTVFYATDHDGIPCNVLQQRWKIVL